MRLMKLKSDKDLKYNSIYVPKFSLSLNDAYEHSVGNLALKEAGNAIQCSIRADNDWVARYGGDEFFICLNNTTYDELRIILKGALKCRRIQKLRSELVLQQGERVFKRC